MTPQLALRVAIVGSLALIMFAAIFFRLWFLQVLSSGQYTAQAASNIIKHVTIPAPRGEILADDGTPLVTSAEVPAVEIAPQSLPVPLNLSDIEAHPGSQPAKDYAVYSELAKLLNISTKPQSCKFIIYYTAGPKQYSPRLAQIPCLVAQGIANSQYANVTIKTDVSQFVYDYLQERLSIDPRLQGVVPTEVYLRQYPYYQLASQVFGYVQPLESTEVHDPNFKGANSSDVVGQTGLEYEYNQQLMGTDGYEAVKVNSANEFQGYGKEKPPVPGANLKTSLDLKLQQVGQRALAESIAKNSYAGANSGAFVAMNYRTGAIYAMGSLPNYHPSTFTHPVSDKTWASLNSKASGDPLLNRAIDGPLPDGSTFKVITATAALQSGIWSLGDTYNDTGEYVFDRNEPCTVPGNCLHNSGDGASGVVNLEQAIQVSDDVFFYNLGDLLNQGDELQVWAHRYGIGEPTGVDLPGEASGVMGSPAYVRSLDEQEKECETATGIYSYTNGDGVFSAKPEAGLHPSPLQPNGCGIALKGGTSTWGPGDNVNAAVGQGYDEVTPLQLAVVYAALANGGSIVTPHIGEDVQTASGTILQRIDPGIKRNIGINPVYLNAILEGLHAAAQSPGGTSYDVMGSFPRTVYGKTGTAQVGTDEQIATNTEADDAWYACFVPSAKRPIVVVVSVEKGGFGDVAAAPVAREILSQWFLGRPGKYVTGTATTGKNST